MYILTLQGSDQQAYASSTKDGSRSLQLFIDKDDAVRYAGLLEADDHPALEIVEVDDDGIVKTCELMGYKYSIITPDDFVIRFNVSDAVNSAFFRLNSATYGQLDDDRLAY